MGAMIIVELIDAHEGFNVVTGFIKTGNKRKLLWIICIITFFLSAVLDNLTTTIVMISLLRKLIKDKSERFLFAGMVVIAANSGGAWSPIGDVTTTMLWIGGQITAAKIIPLILLPSLVSMLVPLLIVSFSMKGNIVQPKADKEPSGTTAFERNMIFGAGIAVLIFVPVFKTITHLPPFMGILLGLSVLWLIAELIHSKKDEEEKRKYSVSQVLKKIEIPSILFFLGILLAISALEISGVLGQFASMLDKQIGNESIIVISIGIMSAIVDNVPLVAAAMGMYPLDVFGTDHMFWMFLAYCAGTGGSILIIGSAAGVAAMGMENIEFFKYLKKIGWLALLGYFAGAFVFILQNYLL
jgi:Na+/H+ antiporter NhaD/arsenite permease-like protein